MIGCPATSHQGAELHVWAPLSLFPSALSMLAQKTQLRMSGIYVKSVVPDSPAAECQKLKTGDRILAVNGISLVGMDYGV